MGLYDYTTEALWMLHPNPNVYSHLDEIEEGGLVYKYKFVGKLA